MNNTTKSPEQTEAERDTDHLADLPDYIVLYDGVCAFCHAGVRSLMDLDTRDKLHYAPLQGETAKRLGVVWDDEAPASDATFRFVDNTGSAPVIHERMDGVAAELAAIDRLPAVRFLLRLMARPVGDLLYKTIAASRYRLFGQYDECKLPTSEERACFLP